MIEKVAFTEFLSVSVVVIAMVAPDSFVSSLPDVLIPTATLRTLEDHDRVLHVVPLSVVATNSGEETERFFSS
jgi:hypothetical protein